MNNSGKKKENIQVYGKEKTTDISKNKSRSVMSNRKTQKSPEIASKVIYDNINRQKFLKSNKMNFNKQNISFSKENSNQHKIREKFKEFSPKKTDDSKSNIQNVQSINTNVNENKKLEETKKEHISRNTLSSQHKNGESSKHIENAEVSMIEIQEQKKTDERRSEVGAIDKVLSVEYNKNPYDFHSRKDASEELSMFSQRINNANNIQMKTSVNGGVESSIKDSKASSTASHQDWVTTSLYKTFCLNYDKERNQFPCIKDGKLLVTTLQKSLSDYLFEKYYRKTFVVTPPKCQKIS